MNGTRTKPEPEAETTTGPGPEPVTDPPLRVPPARDARTWEVQAAPSPRLSDAELQRRMMAAFPESAGPATYLGEAEAAQYGVPAERFIRIGRIPDQMDPQLRDRENAEREARQAAVPPEVRAARELIEAEMAAERRRF